MASGLIIPKAQAPLEFPAGLLFFQQKTGSAQGAGFLTVTDYLDFFCFLEYTSVPAIPQQATASRIIHTPTWLSSPVCGI